MKSQEEIQTLAKRTKTAVDEAELAFWAVIARHFPEIKTGDLDPINSWNLTQTMTSMVILWRIANTEEGN